MQHLHCWYFYQPTRQPTSHRVSRKQYRQFSSKLYIQFVWKLCSFPFCDALYQKKNKIKKWTTTPHPKVIVRNDEECAIYFRKVFHHTFFPSIAKRRENTFWARELYEFFSSLDKNNDDDGKRKLKQIAEKCHGVSFFIYIIMRASPLPWKLYVCTKCMRSSSLNSVCTLKRTGSKPTN